MPYNVNQLQKSFMSKITIYHQLCKEEFYIPNWEIKYLFLGTFNPDGGQKVNYYYGRNSNQTWKILSQVFETCFDTNEPVSFFKTIFEKKIACADMIHSVKAHSEKISGILGRGYSDTKIINNSIDRNYNTTLIQGVIRNNPSVLVFSTWGNGSNLKEWRNEISKISEIIPLASPSLVAKVPQGQKKFDYMLADWKSKISV
jgi:hypothetical protein